MTKLKIYYDGWLALPASLRRQLDLETDAVLEAELVDGTIVLQPIARTKNAAMSEPEQTVIELPAVAPAPLPDAELVALPAEPQLTQVAEHQPDARSDLSSTSLPSAKRRPGRPRKVHVAERTEPVTAPKRPRGRPRKIAPQSELTSPAFSEGVHSELRRKVVLPTAIHEHGAVRGRRPVRSTSSAGHEREERRPFAHVEVRKLGPGRRNNRPRGFSSQP